MGSLKLRVWVRSGVLVLAILSARAEAADRTEDQLIRDGVEARRRQEDARALDLFTRAYGLHHSPCAAAQMGLADMALGRWVEAEAHLGEALAATDHPWIQKNRQILEESLARVRQEVGRLDVLGDPPGAEVVIGGEVKGALPLPSPIHVRVGDVHFELRAPGFQSDTRTVHVVPGQLARETVRLAPLPRVRPAPGPPLAEKPSPPAPVQALQTPKGGHDGAGLRVASLAVGGAGLLALGAGLTFGLKAQSAGRSDSAATTFNRSADASGHRYQTLQWIGYGVGGALVAAGVTMYIAGSGRSAPESGMSTSFVPTQGGGMAFIGGGL